MMTVYKESEISIRKGFVFKGEVPPLTVKGFEAVGEHGAAEYHSVAELLLGNAAAGRAFAIVASVLSGFGIPTEIRMTFRAEPVKGAAHVQFLPRGHVKERQIHC